MQTMTAELLFFRTPKNSCGFIFAAWRIRFFGRFAKKPLKSTKINLAKINFFKVDNNNNISNRVSEIRREKLSQQNPLR